MTEDRAAQRRLLIADLLLVTVTMFWGTSFALVKEVLEATSVPNLMFIRFGLTALFLLPVALIKQRGFSRDLIRPGIICGLLLFSAFLTQANGLVHTSASRSGFITGLNVILVPIFAIFLLRRMPTKQALIGAGLAFGGLYFLTAMGGTEELPFNIGDVWSLGCAIVFAGHIVALGRYSPGLDSFWLAYVQFVVIALASMGWATASGDLNLSVDWSVIGAAAFLAVTCTIYAFWTQTWAQKYTTPTRTAIIYALEPVFAAIFAMWWLGESMGLWALVGGGMIIGGILISELKTEAWSA